MPLDSIEGDPSSSRRDTKPYPLRRPQNAANEYTGAAFETLHTSDASASSRTFTNMSSRGDPALEDDADSEMAIDSVRYTKTGRVSKAEKGQRVHHCEECGKTYTRAEHLRRHKQNHQPGAFPCDIAGCHRSFNRPDLLMRHKARHNDPSSRANSSVPNSPAGQLSPSSTEPLQSRASTAYLSPDMAVLGSGDSLDPQSLPYPNIPQQSSRSGKHSSGGYMYQQALLDPVGAASGTQGPNFQASNMFSYDGSANSTPYGSPGYDIERVPYYQQQSNQGHFDLDTFHTAVQPAVQISRSPGSSGSSTTYLPHVLGWDTPALSFNAGGADAVYSQTLGTANLTLSDAGVAFGALESLQVLVNERDKREAQTLAVPSLEPSAGLGDSTYTNEQRYLGAYFTHIHHFFPVVHRQTVSTNHTSPLLTAAMLALGAQALQDRVDKNNARVIHERCIKVLRTRTIGNSHTYRLSDLQAIVLVEVYSIYKSRRPPLQLSQPFECVYRHLVNDPQASTQSTWDNSPYQSDASPSRRDQELSSIDVRCKQRVLLACYTIDQQHAALFGRRSLRLLSGVASELAFPSPQAVWDNRKRRTAKRVPPNVQSAIETCMVEPQEYDCFQSTLLMSTMVDDSVDRAAAGHFSLEDSPLVSSLERQARSDLTYHTLMLCQSTPIRKLLAVAGESWVMAEKLMDAQDFTTAQMETYEWARGDSVGNSVNVAVKHALRVLEIHYHHPITGLLFQEWSIYLAAVVLWARAYVTAVPAHRPLAAMGSMVPSYPMYDAHDIDLEVLAVVANGPYAHINMPQAMAILNWTKARIERVDVPHNCGLTNGALDVLSKLVLRGDEVGWFGC